MQNNEFLTGNLLSTKELSELLGVNTNTLSNWRKEKGLPFIQVEKTIRYNRQEVEVWLKSQKKNK